MTAAAAVEAATASGSVHHSEAGSYFGEASAST